MLIMSRMSTLIQTNTFIQTAGVNIPVQELHTSEVTILWIIAPKVSASVRIRRRLHESRANEKKCERRLWVVWVEHTHTHTQARCVANEPRVRLWCLEPDRLHAQTDGSSVRSHHFLLRSSASSSESYMLLFATIIKADAGLPEGLCFSFKVSRETGRLKHEGPLSV